MESFNFELKLVSDIDKVAKRGVDPLKKVEEQAKRSQKALDWGSNLGKQFERVGFVSARAAKKQHDQFAASWAKIGVAAEKSAQRQKRAFEKAVERRADQMRDNSLGAGVKEGLGFGRLTSAAFIGGALAEGAFKAADLLIDGAHKVVDMFEEGITRAFEEASKQQTLRIGEKLSLGKGGGEFREDAERFSHLTGFDADSIRGMLLPLRRAGMNQQGVRTAFAAASDVAAGEGRGGDAGRVQELLGAFQRIKLTGEVQTRFLSQIGVEQKGVYAEIAKTLHVSADEAKKRAAGGKVDPQIILNALYHGIERQQGGKLGTGSIAYSKSFEARFERLKNLPNEFLKNLVDSPNFQRASDLMAGLLEKLDPDSPAGQRIMGSIEGMFDKITSFIGDPEDAAESIADKLEDAIGFAKELTDDFRSWADALLPSLETIEDMFFAMRKFKAIASGNQADLAAATIDQAMSDQKRVARATEKRIRSEHKDTLASNTRIAEMNQRLSDQVLIGPLTKESSQKVITDAAARTKADEDKARGSVTVIMQPGAVQVAGDTSNPDTHKEAGENAGHLVRELGRAAQGGGG